MKKLLGILAVVSLAFSASAATVSWSASGLGDYNGKTAVLLAFAAGTEVDVATAAYNGAASTTSGALLSADATIASGRIMAASVAAPNLENGNSYDFYMIIYNDAVEADATQYAVFSVKDSSVSGTGRANAVFKDVSSSLVWNDTAKASAGETGAIPEPTSGLLVLLGMAGLALKRKRA